MIDSLQQFHTPYVHMHFYSLFSVLSGSLTILHLPDPRIVAGCNLVHVHSAREVLEESTELYPLVANDVWIWGESFPKSLQELAIRRILYVQWASYYCIPEDVIPILLYEVHSPVRYAQFGANLLHGEEVFL